MILSPQSGEHSMKYKMTISRLTINKLGIQMYDRVSAVLAELVANCYDAEAEHVDITLPFGVYLADRNVNGTPRDLGFEITLADDGIGMTVDEVNDFYLKVGIDRRTRGDITETKHRKVLGRKGIGKLAPFGICREIEVLTAGGKANSAGQFQVCDLILKYDDMLSDREDSYNPQPGPKDGTTRSKTGTTIFMRDFDRRRVPPRSALNRQLSARFGIEGADWKVTVMNSLDPSDTFDVGDLDISIMEGTKVDLSDRPVLLKDQGGDVVEYLPVSGWVAYARVPYKDDSMAGVRIFARGKIVAQTRDFNIESGFTGEYKMRSYVVGQINAEWIDESEDLIRSDRQDIIWTSEKGEAFQTWGQQLLRELAKRGDVSVQGTVWEEFLEKSRLHERLHDVLPNDQDLRGAVEQAAKSVVRAADRERVASEPEFVERVVQLAFAIGPHRTLLATLDEVGKSTSASIEPIMELFEKAGMVEMYSLGQVASERVEAIATLRRLVKDSSTKEDALQKLTERCPWILYPDWTPLTQNAPLERLRGAFEAWYERSGRGQIRTSAISNAEKEPDFVMLNYGGHVEVVEIKRPEHALSDEEFSRAFGYLNSVSTFLDENRAFQELFPTCRLTIICDRLALKYPPHIELIKTNSRIQHKTWIEILAATQRAHQDFLVRVQTLTGARSLPHLEQAYVPDVQGDEAIG